MVPNAIKVVKMAFTTALVRILTFLTCASSVLPYLLIAYGRGWQTEVLMFSGSAVWALFFFLTQTAGGWARSLRWLWFLSPVAFGPQLYVILLVILIGLKGFAP
jgi:hypothetical protein